MKNTVTIIFSAITGLIIVAALWNNEIGHKILVSLFGVTLSYGLYLLIVIRMALNEEKQSSGADIPEQAAE